MKWLPIWSCREQNYEPLPTQTPPFTQTMSFPCNIEGNHLRILFSNQYGKENICIQDIYVECSNQRMQVLIEGKHQLILEPGQVIYSDACIINVGQKQTIRIQCSFPKSQTFHGYFGMHSNAFLQTTFSTLQGRELQMHSYSMVLQKPFHPYVYFGIRAIEIGCEKSNRLLGICGDSLVHQGHWTSSLQRKLMETYENVTIYNEGISGNRLLKDATSSSKLNPIFGNSAVSRYTNDMFQRYQNDISIVGVGINDLVHPGNGCDLAELCDTRQMIEGYQKILAMNQSDTCYIATLMPFYNYDQIWDEQRENIRQQVNQWIRTLPNVLDLDQWVRDAQDMKCLQLRFDSGDHLHINAHAGDYIATRIANVLANDVERRLRK